MTHLGRFLIQLANRTADAAVLTAAFVFGTATRYYLDLTDSPLFENFSWDTLMLLFLVFLGLNHISLTFNAAYPTSRLRTFNGAAWIYFKSVYMAMAWIVVLAFVIQPLEVSRLLLFSATSYAFLLLLIKERIFRFMIRQVRARGRNLRHVVLVGDDETWLKRIIGQIHEDPSLGLKVTGIVTLQSDPRKEVVGIRRLGDVSGLEAIIEEEVVDCIIFPGQSAREGGAIRDCIWQCEQRGIEVWLTLNFSQTTVRAVEIEHLEDMSFLSLKTGPRNAAAIMVKYALDRVVSFVLLVLLSPIMILVAILVKCTSPGPIFFKSYRTGINGRKFVFLKFRSMINNAEAYKEALQHRNEMKGPVFKIKDDPRITPFGRFIRKTSIDELPQLINVLRGDMSLVGPRPLPVLEAAKIHGANRRRLSMKPGITCIWQVTGRNRIVDFDEWANLDLKYIDNWSLWLDIKLLLQTIPAVLKGTGV